MSTTPFVPRYPRSAWRPCTRRVESLVATGAATKLTTGAGAADTRARYDARPDLHYHFRCLRTGEVHDLPTAFDPELISKLDPQLSSYLSRQGFQVTGYRLELVGYQDSHPSVSASGADSSHDPSSGPRHETMRQDRSIPLQPLDESGS